jgi:hypothetical protein
MLPLSTVDHRPIKPLTQARPRPRSEMRIGGMYFRIRSFKSWRRRLSNKTMMCELRLNAFWRLVRNWALLGLTRCLP